MAEPKRTETLTQLTDREMVVTHMASAAYPWSRELATQIMNPKADRTSVTIGALDLVGITERESFYDRDPTAGDKNEYLIKVDDVYEPYLNEEELNERREFMVLLCAALHRSGAPTHHNHWLCQNVSRKLQVQGVYTYLVTSIMITFNDANFTTNGCMTRQLELDQAMDMAKVGRLTDLCLEIINGLDFQSAKKRLSHVVTHKYSYRNSVLIPTYGLLSGLATLMFFEGSMVDALLAIPGGILVGLSLIMFVPKFPLFGRVATFVLSLLCSLMASALAALFTNKICTTPVSFGAIVWLLPGLGLTISVCEMSHNQLLSGIAHFMSNTMATIQLAFGLSLGPRLLTAAGADGSQCKHTDSGTLWPFRPPPNLWILLIPSLLTFTCFAIICSCTPRQIPAVWLASSAIWYIPKVLLQNHFGFNADACTFIAALLLGVIGGVFSQFGRHPLAMVVPSVFLLVPGGMSVQGPANMMAGDQFAGVNLALHTLQICILVAVGLVLGNGLVPSIRRDRFPSPL